MWAGGSRPKEPTGPDADPHNTSRLNTTRGSPIIQTAATAAKGGGCGRLAGDCGTLMLPFFINNFKGSIECVPAALSSSEPTTCRPQARYTRGKSSEVQNTRAVLQLRRLPVSE
jgi:hypothetical protein